MSKPLSQDQYAALLEGYIAHLDAEMMALSPSGWSVASLQDSYASCEASAAMSQVWDAQMTDLAYARYQQAQDKAWAESKIAHQYI